mgnify:CR=1 FL=1
MAENLVTKKCVVAFLDLLGTSEAIKNDEHDANLNSINKILQAAFDICADTSTYSEPISIKAFSDNIVFSIELPDEIDEQMRMKRVHNILEACACFQMAAFSLGISTRGGITVGAFFTNDIFVWGKGLIRAYTLENKIAIFPRIVLDSNVVSLLPERDDNGNKYLAATDSDGIVFLDYLSFIPIRNRNEYIKRALQETNHIIECIDHDERAVQKIKWISYYLEKSLTEE